MREREDGNSSTCTRLISAPGCRTMAGNKCMELFPRAGIRAPYPGSRGPAPPCGQQRRHSLEGLVTNTQGKWKAWRLKNRGWEGVHLRIYNTLSLTARSAMPKCFSHCFYYYYYYYKEVPAYLL